MSVEMHPTGRRSQWGLTLASCPNETLQRRSKGSRAREPSAEAVGVEGDLQGRARARKTGGPAPYATIAVSSTVMTQYVQEALESCVDAHVSKMVEPTKLLTRVLALQR